MSQANTSKIAKSGLWLTLSFLFVKAIQFVAQIFLARLLAPAEFGIWGMVLVITNLAELFKDATISGVLIQRGLDDKKLVDTVYSLGVNISVILFVTQALIGYPASLFFNEPIVFPLTACAASVFLINAGAGTNSAVMQRQMRFKELAIVSSASGFTRFGTAILVAILGGGVWSFAIAEVTSSVVNSTLKRWYSRYPFQYSLIPDAAKTREVKGFITSLIGINLAVYVNTNGDDFLIGRLLGTQSLGFYSIAYQLAMVPMFALSQMNRVNFSVISQRDNDGQRVYVKRMLELCAVISAPVYGVAFVVAPWLIPLVYGAEWQPTVILFQIVIVFAYARGFMSILGTALNAIGRPEINAAINWFLVPLCIPAFYFGARWAGIVGVSFAVAGVMGIGATLWFWVSTCRAAHWSLLELVKPVILPTAATCLMVAIATSLPSSGYSGYIVQPLLVALGYLLIVSVGSKGKIPLMVTDVMKRSLNLKT